MTHTLCLGAHPCINSLATAMSHPSGLFLPRPVDSFGPIMAKAVMGLIEHNVAPSFTDAYKELMIARFNVEVEAGHLDSLIVKLLRSASDRYKKTGFLFEYNSSGFTHFHSKHILENQDLIKKTSLDIVLKWLALPHSSYTNHRILMPEGVNEFLVFRIYETHRFEVDHKKVHMRSPMHKNIYLNTAEFELYIRNLWSRILTYPKMDTEAASREITKFEWLMYGSNPIGRAGASLGRAMSLILQGRLGFGTPDRFLIHDFMVFLAPTLEDYVNVRSAELLENKAQTDQNF